MKNSLNSLMIHFNDLFKNIWFESLEMEGGTFMGYANAGGGSFSSVLGLSYNSSTGNLTISNAGNSSMGGFYYYRGSTHVFTICIVS